MMARMISRVCLTDMIKSVLTVTTALLLHDALLHLDKQALAVITLTAVVVMIYMDSHADS